MDLTLKVDATVANWFILATLVAVVAVAGLTHALLTKTRLFQRREDHGNALVGE